MYNELFVKVRIHGLVSTFDSSELESSLNYDYRRREFKQEISTKSDTPFYNIYNGIIYTSLNPAIFFNSIP